MKAKFATTAPSESELEVALAPISDIAALEAEWRGIESDARVSFFQSWDWIGSLIETVPEPLRPWVARVGPPGRPVAVALVGRSYAQRRVLIRSRGLHLNETGVPAHDAVTMEHNDFVAVSGLESSALAALVGHMARRDGWDELYIGGMATPRFAEWAELGRAAGLRGIVRWERPFHYVDLEQIRTAGLGYLDSLSANTRYQVRRARKLYAGRGELNLQVAQSLPEAEEWLRRLAELHQVYWLGRGQPGAFASATSRGFHAALLRRGWPRGSVELAQVKAGGTEIGYAYNFRAGGTLYNYQSGFVYDDDAKLKPGLVTHSLIAESALQRGLSRYDLLMGDSQYKRSLTNASGSMVWGVLQQPRLLLGCENTLRTLKERWDRHHRGDTAQGGADGAA